MHKRLDRLGEASLWGGEKPPSPYDSKLPVLMIVHQHQSSPGHIGNWFRANGYPLDIRRPRFGDPLPDTLAEHAGTVIFGGPQSANDNDDFIRRETGWISVALKEEKPFLGICTRTAFFTTNRDDILDRSLIYKVKPIDKYKDEDYPILQIHLNGERPVIADEEMEVLHGLD